MGKIICLRHRQQASSIYILCLHRQSVSVTDSPCLWQTVCVCHIQSVSVTDSVCHIQYVLSQSVDDSHSKYLFVRERVCPSQAVCVCHRQSVSVPDSLFWTHPSVFVKDFCVWHKCLCLTQMFVSDTESFECQPVSLSYKRLDHYWPNFIREARLSGLSWF